MNKIEFEIVLAKNKGHCEILQINDKKQMSQHLIYEIPSKVVVPLKMAGLGERQTYTLEMDGNLRIFEILFQFYESSLIYKMSSSHHFNDSTLIEDLVLVIQISELLDLNQIVDDLLVNTLDPNVSEKNCLYLVDKFYYLLNSRQLGDTSGIFFESFAKILDFCSFNLKHLLKHCRET